MDQLIDRTCGTNPLERKLNARLDRAKLDDKVLAAVKTCVDAALDIDVKVPLKALSKWAPRAEASFRACLNQEQVADPRVLDLLTGYVRAAFAGDAADQQMLHEYARCYANVLRCRRNPCPAGPVTSRLAQAAPAPLTLSVKLLAAIGGGEKFQSVPAATTLHSGDHVVFEVKVSRPAFVYIVQRPAQGPLNVLFPSDGTAVNNPIDPVPLRLPADRHCILDDETGTEKVLIVASEHEQMDLAARVAGYQERQNQGQERALYHAIETLSAPGPGQPTFAKVTESDGRDLVSRGLVLSPRVVGGAVGAGGEPVFKAQVAPHDHTVVLQVAFLHAASGKP